MGVQTIKTKVTPVLREEGVIKAGLFGSYATGRATRKSDVDLVVQFGHKKSLFEVARLKLRLEEVLSKKVDLLIYRSIHPLLRETILNQQQTIY